MEAKLQKWGNSLGIRIPSNILKTLGMSDEDIVDISSCHIKFVEHSSRNDLLSE